MYTTRIAPSPTGMMHIGTVRTAYFNYLAARASGGRFILRIDDTDAVRSDDAFVQIILDTFDWLGLDYDDLFFQSKRLDIYNDVSSKLVDAGLAFDDGDVIRLVKALDQPKGPVQLVLRKSDGMPTYHFASVVDDWMMGINYIIRGVDHVDNLPKHQLIWDSLSAIFGVRPSPKIDHVGLIHKDKKKLSKRDGAASALIYKDKYSPDALLNFLVRMGWGPKDDNKQNSVLTRARTLDLFLDHGNLRQSPANFDQAKLDWYQKKFENIPG